MHVFPLSLIQHRLVFLLGSHPLVHVSLRFVVGLLVLVLLNGGNLPLHGACDGSGSFRVYASFSLLFCPFTLHLFVVHLVQICQDLLRLY